MAVKKRGNHWFLLMALTTMMLILASGIWNPDQVSKQVQLNNVYHQLRDMQLSVCGPLCDFSKVKFSQVTEWDFTVHPLQQLYRSVDPVDCSLFFSKEAEMILEGPPIEESPPEQLPLKDDFTMGGRIQVKPMFLKNIYLGNTQHEQTWSAEWTREKINSQIERLRNGEMHGTYGKGPTNFFSNILRSPELDMRGKRVLVIGSEKPWVEIACLLAGASEVTTVDYGKILTTHPQLKTLTPSQLNEQVRQDKVEQFDIAVSFSSIEHSGLGRYGDRLNPWGDIIAMAKVGCLVKHEGTMLIGLPSDRIDSIYYNAHRTYGLMRWPLLLTNWYPLKAWREKEGVWQNGIVWAINKAI